MVTDVNRHCGDNFAICTNIKPICCTLQNNTNDVSYTYLCGDYSHAKTSQIFFKS